MAAEAATTTRLLGLFNTGNMDGALDRKFLKGGTVKTFPRQPDLTEQVAAALSVLSRNPDGFFLMVESGLIDKYTHVLDMERAIYDTIMLDNAVKLARDWAASRGDDTLILVLADHAHPVSLIGTIDDDMATLPNVPLRERVRVYDRAGFPNYPAPDANGYPARVDVSRRLALFSASLPNYYETFRPKLDNPNVPTVPGTETGTFEANRTIRVRAGGDAAPGQPAAVRRLQRAFGGGRCPDGGGSGQRAGARATRQHRDLPHHGRGAGIRTQALSAPQPTGCDRSSSRLPLRRNRRRVQMWRRLRDACPGDDFEAAVGMLGNGGAAFHPVPAIDVADAEIVADAA